MIKRTIYIESECHLSVEYEQLKITNKSTGELNSLPLEDLGFVMLDNSQITYTNYALQKFAQYNIATVICDQSHLPIATMNPLVGHTTQTANYNFQIEASEALKKSLWKQTIIAKINNQANVLKKHKKEYKFLSNLAKDVKTDDSTNREAVAAKYYWANLFEDKNFTRSRDGVFPNSLLNYSYAIIRAGIARALIGSGLLPTIGIHHRNKYNPMCLADDIMEPYRPYADLLVYDYIKKNPNICELDKQFKLEALKLLTADTKLRKLTRPMMIAFTYTSASLAKCFAKKLNNINYPKL